MPSALRWIAVPADSPVHELHDSRLGVPVDHGQARPVDLNPEGNCRLQLEHVGENSADDSAVCDDDARAAPTLSKDQRDRCRRACAKGTEAFAAGKITVSGSPIQPA